MLIEFIVNFNTDKGEISQRLFLKWFCFLMCCLPILCACQCSGVIYLLTSAIFRKAVNLTIKIAAKNNTAGLTHSQFSA